ncbi:hypothetical protein AB205_0098340 [Aquarana catesbeiana]|uniref:Uncharacterized protein n=1 Tax=Aquarana catesbeiana TaxID=8400 RepID=A0A2G9SD68_AQUCT|nr:hypothetical protein AB205_0098340 [Aquarana catesbeiana]
MISTGLISTVQTEGQGSCSLIDYNMKSKTGSLQCSQNYKEKSPRITSDCLYFFFFIEIPLWVD